MIDFSLRRAGIAIHAHSRHQDALILALIHKISESTICHGIDVWFGILSGSAPVHIHDIFRIDRQRAVRINRYKEEPRVGLVWISILLTHMY